MLFRSFHFAAQTGAVRCAFFRGRKGVVHTYEVHVEMKDLLSALGAVVNHHPLVLHRGGERRRGAREQHAANRPQHGTGGCTGHGSTNQRSVNEGKQIGQDRTTSRMDGRTWNTRAEQAGTEEAGKNKMTEKRR